MGLTKKKNIEITRYDKTKSIVIDNTNSTKNNNTELANTIIWNY